MPSHIRTRRLASGKKSYAVSFQVASDAKGKPVYVRKSFSRRRDADSYLTGLKRARETGTLVAPSHKRLETYMNEWLKIVQPTLRPNTYQMYASIIRARIVPYLGNIKLKDLRPATLQRWLADLQGPEHDIGPGGIRGAFSVLRRAMGHAVKLGEIGLNPARGCDLPRYQPAERRFLEPEQARAFLRVTSETDLAAYFELALFAGCRPSELLGLAWSAVDLEAGTIRIERSLCRVSATNWSFEGTKTKSGRRTLAIPANTVQVLRAHRRRQAEQRLKAGSTWAGLDLVFSNEAGEPLVTAAVRAVFKTCLRRTSVVLFPGHAKDPEVRRQRDEFERLRLYDLRHTAASLLLASGVNVRLVAERMGHADPGLTLRVYAHVMPTDRQLAADKVAAFVGGSTNAARPHNP